MTELAVEAIRVSRVISDAALRHGQSTAYAWEIATKAAKAQALIYMDRNPGTLDDLDTEVYECVNKCLQKDLVYRLAEGNPEQTAYQASMSIKNCVQECYSRNTSHDEDFNEEEDDDDFHLLLWVLLIRKARAATKKVAPLVEKAAVNGSLLGHREAQARLKDLGDPPASVFQFESDGLLKLLLQDAQNLEAQFPPAAIEAMKTGDPDKVKSVFKRFALRAHMISEASLKMHAYRALIKHMRGTNSRAMWKATSDNPCLFCKTLDGQIVEWGEIFTLKDFPIYGGVLNGPQLHPYCSCTLVVLPK